jgi:hypothetical protein
MIEVCEESSEEYYLLFLFALSVNIFRREYRGIIHVIERRKSMKRRKGNKDKRKEKRGNSNEVRSKENEMKEREYMVENAEKLNKGKGMKVKPNVDVNWGFGSRNMDECFIMKDMQHRSRQTFRHQTCTYVIAECIRVYISIKSKVERFESFTDVPMKNVVFWDIKTQFVLHRRHITSPLQSPAS